MSTPENSDATAAATAMASEPTINSQLREGHTIMSDNERAEYQTTGLLRAARAAEQMARLIDGEIADLDPDAPLWSVVDLTAAAAHLRTAARLVDRAAARINAQEVTR